ncbi:MAG: chain length determinant protein EpsF [Aquabacterium sp.]
MSLSQLLSILRARWWIAALIFVVAVGTTLAVSLSLDKQYTASATLVLDSKPDPVSVYTGAANPTYIATQVDIIESSRVAQRVVKNLRLIDNPQVRGQWMEATGGSGSMEAWLADSFSKNLTVRPSLQSSVITVSYKAGDPRFAAGLANAFVQAYLETSVDLRVNPARQYNTFFDQRVKDARETYEKAQARYSTFQRERGIIASDERLDIETSRLNELNSQVTALQAISAESNSREAAARSTPDRLTDIMNSPLVLSLKGDLSRQEVRMQELNARFGDAHPLVQELRANIDELRQKLDAEVKRATSSVGVTGGINRSREAQTRVQLENQRQKVLKLKAVRDEGQLLQRDLETAQRAFDAVSARATQTSLESQATQTNAYQLAAANPPLEPSGPKVLLNTAISVFLGLLLATGVILAIELIDRRVRSHEDITAGLGVPVLGVLPKPNARRLVGKPRLSLMQQRLVGQLPAPGKAS